LPISIVTLQAKEFLSICPERMLTAQLGTSTVRISVVDQSELLSMILGPARIIIVVTNVAMVIGEMTVTGTTVTTKKKDIVVIAQGRPVALNMMNVVQLGLLFPGESLTIKDLQGTIRTDAETTEDATTKTSALKRGRGTQMEKDGRVEWYLFSMVA